MNKLIGSLAVVAVLSVGAAAWGEDGVCPQQAGACCEMTQKGAKPACCAESKDAQVAQSTCPVQGDKAVAAKQAPTAKEKKAAKAAAKAAAKQQKATKAGDQAALTK